MARAAAIAAAACVCTVGVETETMASGALYSPMVALTGAALGAGATGAADAVAGAAITPPP
ncbi:MAG: hypothetical protein ABJA82_05375 [Myxococcales bacterium]